MYEGSNTREDVLILFGAGDAWEAVKIRDNFKRYFIENTKVFKTEFIIHSWKNVKYNVLLVR